MTRRPLTSSSAAGLVSAVLLSGCVSAADASAPMTDALLLNPEANSVRNAVRSFVREHDGGDYIVEPDSLSASSVLELVVRERRDDTDARVGFSPRPDYRLAMDEEGRCWLLRTAEGSPDQRLWVQDADCKAA